MFITKTRYHELTTGHWQTKLMLESVTIKERVTSEANAVLRVNLDHLRLRVNQLEKERAQLTHAILGVRIPVPEFESVAPQGLVDAMAELPSFEDMGDEQAKIQGIKHDDSGNVVFGKPLHEEE